MQTASPPYVWNLDPIGVATLPALDVQQIMQYLHVQHCDQEAGSPTAMETGGAPAAGSGGGGGGGDPEGEGGREGGRKQRKREHEDVDSDSDVEDNNLPEATVTRVSEFVHQRCDVFYVHGGDAVKL